jgi:hypothetical protein
MVKGSLYRIVGGKNHNNFLVQIRLYLANSVGTGLTAGLAGLRPNLTLGWVGLGSE